MILDIKDERLKRTRMIKPEDAKRAVNLLHHLDRAKKFLTFYEDNEACHVFIRGESQDQVWLYSSLVKSTIKSQICLLEKHLSALGVDLTEEKKTENPYEDLPM